MKTCGQCNPECWLDPNDIHAAWAGIPASRRFVCSNCGAHLAPFRILDIRGKEDEIKKRAREYAANIPEDEWPKIKL